MKPRRQIINFYKNFFMKANLHTLFRISTKANKNKRLENLVDFYSKLYREWTCKVIHIECMCIEVCLLKTKYTKFAILKQNAILSNFKNKTFGDSRSKKGLGILLDRHYVSVFVKSDRRIYCNLFDKQGQHFFLSNIK